MSARNFLSAREKNIAKFIDCLPNISHKKCGYRSVQELPPLSASALVNRNIDLSFKIQPYSDESLDRVSTPFSDFFSDSETGKKFLLDCLIPGINSHFFSTSIFLVLLIYYQMHKYNHCLYSKGTPDFRSEESDSSAGSALRRNTEAATKTLEEEWEKIERTLYNEDGEKTTRQHMLEECRQWRQLHPQLR